MRDHCLSDLRLFAEHCFLANKVSSYVYTCSLFNVCSSFVLVFFAAREVKITVAIEVFVDVSQ